eukprot:COSAG01_NODE_6167_length_3814_cov_24.241992_1_plen_145_part_00
MLSGPELAACNVHGGAIASVLKYVQMVLGKSDRFHEVEWQLHLGDIDGLQGRLQSYRSDEGVLTYMFVAADNEGRTAREMRQANQYADAGSLDGRPRHVGIMDPDAIMDGNIPDHVRPLDDILTAQYACCRCTGNRVDNFHEKV